MLEFEDVNLDKKDMSDIVDASREILSEELIDEFLRSLINHIARVVIVNKPNKIEDDCKENN